MILLIRDFRFYKTKVLLFRQKREKEILNMKRIFALILGAVITAATLASCGNSGSDTITVVSREDGSGTRSAFVELMGILQGTIRI